MTRHLQAGTPTSRRAFLAMLTRGNYAYNLLDAHVRR